VNEIQDKVKRLLAAGESNNKLIQERQGRRPVSVNQQ